ncbi:MAG: hypothetical protein ACFFD4_22040 [Candidatus Odinarchaeota archaeon]
MASTLVLDIISKTYGGLEEEEKLTIEVLDDQIKNLKDLIRACVEKEFEKKAGNMLTAGQRALLEEVKRAQESFKKKEYYVFIDSKQIKDLNERIEIDENSRIRFLRVIPLAGG